MTVSANRIPSVRQLEAYGGNRPGSNAAALVEVWHRDLVRDIKGLNDGTILPWGGATKAGELRKTRRQLLRLIANARSVGIEVD